MAVALLATTDNSSSIRFSVREEGPTITLNDTVATESFLITVRSTDPNETFDSGGLALVAEAEHSPVAGSPWVTVTTLGPGGDAAVEMTDAVSFLRDARVGIPTTLTCASGEADPNVNPCTLHARVRFTRAMVPEVTTTLTWTIEGERTIWVDDDEATTHEGTLPWQITFTRL
jgi:hypothetical protein